MGDSVQHPWFGAKFKLKKLSEVNPTFTNGICADLRTLSVCSQWEEVASEGQ